MPQLEGLPAELAVAGMLSAAGWNIYSPHRDVGFDFIATKMIDQSLVIRPVQVKGCYLKGKKDTPTYGRSNFELPQLHDEMVLVMPFYTQADSLLRPLFVAFLPRCQIKGPSGKGTYRALPAAIANGVVCKRPHFAKFFDDSGIELLDLLNWKDTPSGLQ